MAGQCVLTIAQNWRIRKLLRANLEALGLEVREAIDRHHGLGALEEGRPDLILLDLDLPADGAVKLLHVLHRRFRARPVPIILLSAEPPARSILQAAPMADWVLKPFDVSSLVERVQDILGASTAAGND